MVDAAGPVGSERSPIRWATGCGVLVVVIDGPIHAADAPAIAAWTGALLAVGGARWVTCDVTRLTAPDVDTVDALAQLYLEVRERRRPVRFTHAPDALRELVDLMGLQDVLPLGVPSTVEPGRQAEQGEQPLGVEEGVQPDDAPA
jgi:ABC-type transporter Mla MlaB component